MAFDCVWVGARDLRGQPLALRRRALEEAVAGAELIFPTRRLPVDGLEAWELVKKHGYEGLVAKDDDSRYQAGESRSWVKIKVRQDGRFLVGGIGETADRAPRLFIAEEVRSRLVYRGTVELGVGPALVAEILKRGRRRQQSPFTGLPSSKVAWLEPTIAIDVSFGRVMQGWLREPRCRGIAITD
jgi:bifunctional non-homologous end joining protein LigD